VEPYRFYTTTGEEVYLVSGDLIVGNDAKLALFEHAPDGTF
jgi:hypothetical protein